MRTVRSFSREKRLTIYLYKRSRFVTPQLKNRVQDQYNVGVERSFAVGRKNALVTGGFTGMLSLVAQGAIGLVVYEGALEVIKVLALLKCFPFAF